MQITRRFRAFLGAIVIAAFSSTFISAEWSDSAFDGSQGDGESLPKIEVHLKPHRLHRPVDNGLVWVTVRAGSREERSRAANAGMSLEEFSKGKVSGTATLRAIERMKRMGLRIESQSMMEQFPAADKAFHTYAGVTSALGGIASSHKFASIITIGRSLKGRAIQGVRFNTTASGDQPSTKPGIVFLGTHHAREHLSTEVPLLFAKWLAANSGKPEVKHLLDTRDIYIIPLVNPDGAEFDTTGQEYHMQRKNLRQNKDGSIGVDLNRNYGFHFAEGGASDDPNDETYHGPSAFSEPETQAVKNFVDSHENLKVLLSYHTFSELILYPWGHTNDPIDDGPALKAYKNMAEKMAAMTGYTPEQSSELYIASGDTTDWSWGVHKIFSFTFELTPKSMGEGGFYPGAKAIQPTFQKNIKPALYLIALADNPYRAGEGIQHHRTPAPMNIAAENAPRLQPVGAR